MDDAGETVRNALPPQWLEWAVELQFMAQAGITYAKDPYDLERFQRLREIAAEIMSAKSGLDMDTVRGLFCSETGFQTPKMDTRAAIFREGKILLVKEKDSGLWSMPGGWVDVNQSVRGNTVKEVLEESGLRVEAVRLIALHDRNRHNPPPYAYGVCKVFVLCEEKGGSFQPNPETSESRWFGRDELPPMALEKNSRNRRCCALMRRTIPAGIPCLIKKGNIYGKIIDSFRESAMPVPAACEKRAVLFRL